MAVMMKSGASQRTAARSINTRQPLAVRPALLARSSHPEKNQVDLAGLKLPINRQEGNLSSLPPPVDKETSNAMQAGVPAASFPGFTDVMGFWGAPELINGRLAMLGFVAALGAELVTGAPVAAQVAEEPALIALTFGLFTAASLIPTFVRRKPDVVGPFTPLAELINGRAAMIGFAALLIYEAFKHRALF